MGSVWFAPGRVNLIGEHTDYNDGFVLPLALTIGATATVELTDDATVRLTSAQYPGDLVQLPANRLRRGAVSGWAAYPAGVVWILRERGLLGQDRGLSVHLDSDVPRGAGLSSSAAVVCSVVAAADELLGLHAERREWVELARAVETEFVGARTGGMDQMASILCSAGHAVLCDMRSLTTHQLPFTPERDGLCLLVVDTRTTHQHSDGEYSLRRESCEKAAAILGVTALRDIDATQLSSTLAKLPDKELRRRVRHVVTECQRVLEVARLLRGDGRYSEVGALLTASHLSMRDDYEITVPSVDLSVAALLDAGALGARMTGGGFGGCVIGLIPQDLVATAREHVEATLVAAGLHAPGFLLASAADGARRA